MKYADATAYEAVNKLAESDTEHAHQRTVFAWCARALFDADQGLGPIWTRIDGNTHCWSYTAIRHCTALFAIPNGGERDKISAARMKMEGVKAGVPDLMLPVARGQWHGLFIEMKRPTSANRRQGVLSEDQKTWRATLLGNGYQHALCMSFDSALDVLHAYLHSR